MPIANGSEGFVFLHVSKAGGTAFFHDSTQFLGLKLCTKSHLWAMREGFREPAIRKMRDHRCNIFHCEKSRQTIRKRFVRRVQASRSIEYLAFFREPVYHFLSQALWRKKTMTTKGMDGLLREGFSHLHSHAWHIVNPQFKMVQLPKEGIEDVLRFQRSIFGIGVTGFYGLSVCVIFFQLHKSLPSSCRCAFRTDLREGEGPPWRTAGFNGQPSGRKMNVNVTSEQLEKLKAKRSLDAVIYSNAVSLLFARAYTIQRMANDRLICFRSR